MKNYNYVIISSLILIAGGIYVYKELKKNKLSKEQSIMVIVSNGFSTNYNNALSSFEEDFLYAWANAIKENKQTFAYKNKFYNTNGGKSVK